VSWDRVLQSVS